MTHVFLLGGWISCENPSSWCAFFVTGLVFFWVGGWVNVSLRIEVGGVVCCCLFSDYFEDQSRWAQLPKGKV